MTKIVDMTSVAEGDTSALDRAGIASSEKPFEIGRASCRERV